MRQSHLIYFEGDSLRIILPDIYISSHLAYRLTIFWRVFSSNIEIHLLDGLDIYIFIYVHDHWGVRSVIRLESSPGRLNIAHIPTHDMYQSAFTL